MMSKNVLRWTRDIPTKFGWYWHRFTPDGSFHGNDLASKPPVVMRVTADTPFYIEGRLFVLNEEWAGPIDLPEEPGE